MDSREVGHQVPRAAAGPMAGNLVGDPSVRPNPAAVRVDPNPAADPCQVVGPSSLAEARAGPTPVVVDPCRGALLGQVQRASGSPHSQRGSLMIPCARPTIEWHGPQLRSPHTPHGKTGLRSACSGPTSPHGSPHNARRVLAPSPCSRLGANRPRTQCGSLAASQTQEQPYPSRGGKRRSACPRRSPCGSAPP